MIINQSKKILFEKILLRVPFSVETWISYVFFEIKKKSIRYAEKILLRGFFCLKRKGNFLINLIFFQNLFSKRIFFKNLPLFSFFLFRQSWLFDVYHIINFFYGRNPDLIDFYKNSPNQKFDLRAIINLFSLNEKIGKPKVLKKLSEIIFKIGHLKIKTPDLDKTKKNFFFLKENKRSRFIKKCIFQNFFSKKEEQLYNKYFLIWNYIHMKMEKNNSALLIPDKRILSLSLKSLGPLWFLSFTRTNFNIKKKKGTQLGSLNPKKKIKLGIFFFFLRKIKFFLDFV